MRSSRIQEQWNSSRRTLCTSQCQKPISQCQMQFRNAKCNFAMRKFSQYHIRNAKISQCEISQCQFQFRYAKISQYQIRNAKISQCEISQCQSPFRIAKITAFAKFTLRNLQALSSFVINAEPPSIFGVLLFCPIT